MIKFPDDKPRVPKKEPRYFFIYGQPMSGKTFFASYFPHALDINTDDNAEQSRAPFVSLLKDENNEPVSDIRGRLFEIIKGLPQTSFKTVIIDTIEDVVDAVTKQITDEAGEKYISDGKLSYGKGSGMVKKVINDLVLDLKALPVNVIWISREEEQTDIASGVTKNIPALKQKYYNIIAGNCDLVIRTSKVGAGQNITYMREVKAARTKYIPENITNKRVLDLLITCQGMFSDEAIKRYQATKKEGE